jgi:Zn finger protein HypA/HybF involved in hydrogenase expression
MEFKCLNCSKHSFSIKLDSELERDLTFRLYCPKCDTFNVIITDSETKQITITI